VPEWTIVAQAGMDQRTPNIASIVQEIVNRSGWSSGNSLVILITGTGERTAESFNGDQVGAPLLHVEYTADSTNQAPVANAGPDQTVTDVDETGGEDVTLDGTGSSDPDGTIVSYDWTEGGVSIAGGATPTVTLAVGVHTITLTVTDNGEASATDQVVTTVIGSPGASTIEIRVSASSDDAEERANGTMYLTSSDLELVFDKSDQTVGMRFNGVNIPQAATITNAYVQFKVDETNSVATSLTIQGEATGNAATFVNSTGNITSRLPTLAAVSWSPVPPWTTVGQAGMDQRTPDIASVIQEIVDLSGWSSGNSLVIIITGTGERTAESFNGDQAGAPLLHVEY
jgi:hypothetical protein